MKKKTKDLTDSAEEMALAMVGAALSVSMVKKKITFRELAVRSGVQRSTIIDILRGDGDVPLRTLVKLLSNVRKEDVSTEEKRECHCRDPRQEAALRTWVDRGPWLTPEQERDLRDPDVILYPKMRQILINRYHYIRIAFCPFCGRKL